jgi:hypothetical protein
LRYEAYQHQESPQLSARAWLFEQLGVVSGLLFARNHGFPFPTSFFKSAAVLKHERQVMNGNHELQSLDIALGGVVD